MITVGGGYGVTPVIGAFQGAQVTVFEGGHELVETTANTARINGVREQVNIVEKVVGVAYDVYGTIREGAMAAVDLPSSDVLELDCEGAEYGIISEMVIRPRVVIVEVHPQHGVEVDDMRALLSVLGYSVIGQYDFPNKPNATLTATISP